MPNRDRGTSKRVIAIVPMLVCMLVMLGYSIVGNQQSAHALIVLQSPESLPSNLQISLKHAVHGNAHLVWNAKQMTLTVMLKMSGLAPNSTANAADINKGSCETTNSGLVTSLAPVVPAANGGGSLTPLASPTGVEGSLTPQASPTNGRFSPLNNLAKEGELVTFQSSLTDNTKAENSVKAGEGLSKTKITVNAVPALKNGIPSNGWFIAVHNAPILSADKTSIACGDITNFNTSTATNQFVDLTLGATKDPNQAANGVVALSINNNQLIVIITMSGLVPGSKHQTHIHQGSCEDQGPVVYPLAPVVADMRGEGASTTTIPKVSAILNDWYVNVHLGATAADLKTQTGFDPLVCGNIDLASSVG